MMQQYLQVKEKCRDCILFFRLGDFYEMFFDDAEIASKELELVLTGRDCGLEERAPMCGIPYHAANIYVSRLINRGYKIAICEQLEDPSAAQGIVKRDIIKVITPGTYIDSSFLEETRNNYIMSIYINDGHTGICFADISTGEFNCTECIYDTAQILNEISKFIPKEILVQDNISESLIESINERFQIVFTEKPNAYFINDALLNITKQFKSTSKNEFSNCVLYSSNGLLSYIVETQKTDISHINEMEFYNVVDFMSIDMNSRRNLELTETIRDKAKKGSLLWVMDKTSTCMGSRLLRKWIEQPLIDKNRIQQRLDAVEELASSMSLLEDLKLELNKIYDIERIVGKISTQNVNAKELVSLRNSTTRLPWLKNILSNCKSTLLNKLYISLDELKDINSLLEESVIENPSLSIKEGNIIKNGYNQEVDELRTAKLHGKEWIATLENDEREVTGIKSLKVGYNKIFGYYIEISRANYNLIPEGRYIRKQTLANAERYITPELRIWKTRYLGPKKNL
jgi:DNA mismatch repair protein MutS